MIGKFSLLVAALVLVLAAPAAARPKPRHAHLHSDAAHVVVTPGQPVQIVFTAAMTDLPQYSASIENAVRMAIEQHPRVRGFPIRLNVVETRCGQDPDVDADDAAAAQAIVANAQNAAVLGNLCSFGFPAALAVYEAAGVVAISGSATADWLPSPGLTVFDRTVVSDGDGFASWYPLVQALPSDVAWQTDYELELGSAPQPFADLYFDAASLLLDRLRHVSQRDPAGDLVVDRAALAAAIRNTADYDGVTGAIALDPATGNRLPG
jgi:ABC-type branched-subunit amino acid transport system substrate-binding protein